MSERGRMWMWVGIPYIIMTSVLVAMQFETKPADVLKQVRILEGEVAGLRGKLEDRASRELDEVQQIKRQLKSLQTQIDREACQ